MQQMTDMKKEQAMTPILRQAFRPMFLFGAVFSIIAMALWGLALAGVIRLNPYANIMFWHQHEMLFGFVAAIIVGFLLTAVQNWTGRRATHGKTLLVLSLVWLAGRLLMLFGGGLPAWLVVAVDLLFLPLAAVLFARIVVMAGNNRNLFFVPVLVLLTLANVVMHAGVQLGQFAWIQYGSHSAVLVITLIMAIVSGRVLPMFTANGTQTPKVAPLLWLDRTALGSLWLLVVLHLFLLTGYLPGWFMAALFGLSAVATAWRLLRVKFWITGRVPLLWSLHAAVAFIPLGLALFALRYAGFAISQSAAVHSLTAGAMGVMILSMMARVSLGHTGRMLKPKTIMSVAFVLIIGAALIRVLAGWAIPGATMGWYLYATAGWVIAYSLYVIVYTPILVKPREDGRPG
ncbi:MAG: NnrS family protein [Idiomarina sp.]|nr:NnrS family protein [Idiomarina sp.]